MKTLLVFIVLLMAVGSSAKGLKDSWLWSESQFAQAITVRVDKVVLILNGKVVKRARVVQEVSKRDVPQYKVWILKPYQQIRPWPKYMLRNDPYALLPRPSGAKAMSRSESSDAATLPLKPTVRTIQWNYDLQISEEHPLGVKWDVINTKDLVNWVQVATNLTTNVWRFTNSASYQFHRIGASWK